MHQNFVAFRMAFTPSVALALLDEIKRLEDTNIDAMCRIAELETNLAALVAENAGLKHAMAVTLEHVSVTDAGQAGVAAMIINDALHHSETPATDAFLAEVRAQGVEMLAKNHQSIVNALKGDSLFSDGEYRHAAIVSAAVYFAAELRKGGNQ
ncbi:ead/Ea22-like family protein [Escherichia coli]|uniref:ead/Ea22-like family protein n=2 Tax=Escherichia coli TaxID=562 RepID=UPI00201956DC|nr:ead/Ea22-like family protein [Escherichia coli]MCW7168908.1 ead/Ea22-like family protein [Escherichia coli]MCW7204502.1 ead/Ea22-like family protein [Escherichia coli]MCW7257961.1 ead/Ea22-like family protein [Escherichia coli]MCW7291175.1 ead/Ea22-like family protein [Escherichia coli]